MLVSIFDPANQVHEISLPAAVGHQSGIARVIPFPELVSGRVMSLTCTFLVVSGGPGGGRGRGVRVREIRVRSGGQSRGGVGWWEWGVGLSGVRGIPRGTPALNKLIDPEKRSKKLILRFFLCHLDKHFLIFRANSVGNPQRKQLFNV